MSIRAVRGMHDLFGEELARWNAVETKLRAIFNAFGYGEIRTPALEHAEVFSQTVGDETDIVQKQMYKVANEGGSESLVLRPEGTASFIRAVVEHGLHRTGTIQRYFYYLPMFRYERPQKGRLRQFHQYGAELINDPSPEADAEIIILLDHCFRSLNLTEFEVRINSVGCPECRPRYREILKNFLHPKLGSLCELCQSRFERSPLRILDCKNESCQAAIKGAPKILENLCEACRGHQNLVKERLLEASVSFVEDASIVRGLDYYMRTAFEFTSDLLGAQSALCGGGRYDGLSTRFGEKPFPAVGFGMGMERLMLALEAKGELENLVHTPVFFLAPLGEEAFRILFRISVSLKRRGISAEIPYAREKGLKWLLKNADRSKARWAVILGENEIRQNRALLKHLADGKQEELELNRLEELLVGRTKSAS